MAIVGGGLALPDGAGGPAAGDEDGSGLEAKDIASIMSQVGCSRGKAVAALKAHGAASLAAEPGEQRGAGIPAGGNRFPGAPAGARGRP